MNPATISRSATERFVTGMPAAEALASEAERLNAKRVFILAGGTLTRGTDEIARIVERLGPRHAGTFARIGAHAPLSDVIGAINQARDAEADLIVTVGGGSITDSEKVVALGLKAGVESMTDSERFLATYRWGSGNGVSGAATAPDVRVVCVPTTLSAGEINRVAGVMHDERGKIGFEHADNVPVTIIYDPWISRHTPEGLWLSTGVRAIDHATETLASLRSNDYCDAIAAMSLNLLADGLVRSKRDPEDFEGRLRCQIGAWQSMIPIVNGVPMGASHAIGQGLGSICQVPHGHTSCVMLPAVQQWNAGTVPERLRRVSAVLGDENRPAHELLDELIRGLDQPRSLHEVGVETDDALFARIADHAMANPWGKTNPRSIEEPADMIDILRIAAAA